MPVTPALAFNRFGLGPRPGDLERMTGDPREALLAELNTDGALAIDSGLLPSEQLVLAIRRYQAAHKAAQEAGDKRKIKALGRAPHADAYLKELSARIRRSRAAEIGFVERLVAFWANHFAISARAVLVTGLAGSFEREAIRPHVRGKFHDMLLAATRHPAMLFYLNNSNSFGPNSELGLSRKRGLNENHARELLELHTVGVDAGYLQADVTALAGVLTGWTIDINVNHAETRGRFVFVGQRHEPGPATVMGVHYPQAGVDQGEAVLSDLARSPAAARHLAMKLARHFAADVPPPALVESLAATFVQSGGDLGAMARVLVESDDAWAAPTKLKTPQEFVWSSLRALSMGVGPALVKQALVTLGQPLWIPPSPKGFPDDSGEWLAPDALTNRLDVAAQFASRVSIDVDPNALAETILGPDASADTMMAIARAETRPQALALMLMSPEFQRR